VDFLPISELSSTRIPHIKGPWIHNVITIMATTHKKSVFLTKEDFGFGLVICHGMSWVVRMKGMSYRVRGKRIGEG
jgi:hypothetical protein